MQYDDNVEKYGYEGEMTPMKCDELEKWYAGQCSPSCVVYGANEVDEAIAELKEAWSSEHAACEALKQKLEDVQASAYADRVDAGMRERRLWRVLYKACANWAKSFKTTAEMLGAHVDAVKWDNMERTCRAKAEQYR